MQTNFSCETLLSHLQPLSFLFSACLRWELWRMKWVWNTFHNMTWQLCTKWQELPTKWTIQHRSSSIHHLSRCSIPHHNNLLSSSLNCNISLLSQLLRLSNLYNNSSQSSLHLCNNNQSLHLFSRNNSSHSNNSHLLSNSPLNTNRRCLVTHLSTSQEPLRVTVLTFESP